MVKQILHLYIDQETVSLAKSRITNLSSFFQNAINVECHISENSKDPLQEMKVLNIRLSEELEKKNKEIEKLKNEILKFKEKGTRVGTPFIPRQRCTEAY